MIPGLAGARSAAAAEPHWKLPRIVIAAPASGHGKTTVATGLLAAFKAAGLLSTGFKIGPDYIDPGYHELATGRPGRNLDPYLCGEELLTPLLLHGALRHQPSLRPSSPDHSEAPDPHPEAIADIAVIEGVMGLFDGQLGGGGWASTAHVARVIGAPVVLVLDISATSRTAGALVHGLNTFSPDTRISGVILNKAGSSRHSKEVAHALEETGIEVLGVLPRNAGITAPSRHLGLVPVAERSDPAAALVQLAEAISANVDLTKLLAVAHTAPDLLGAPWSPELAIAAATKASTASVQTPIAASSSTSSVAAEDTANGAQLLLRDARTSKNAPLDVDRSTTSPRPKSTQDQAPPPTGPGDRPVVAIAGGRAFTFRYAETTELMLAAGLQPVVFDPVRDTALPAGTAGIYLGGGFPEVHAAELAGNLAMIDALRGAILTGTPTVAECAGLLYLCRTLDGAPMIGALAADATMTERLTLGYRTAVAGGETLLGPAGRRVTGHEFHRTTVTPMAGGQSTADSPDHHHPAAAPEWRLLDGSAPLKHPLVAAHRTTSPDTELGPAWLVDGTPIGYSTDPAGTGHPTLHASYLHIHWAGHPAIAASFAAAVHSYASRDSARSSAAQPGPDSPAAYSAASAEVRPALAEPRSANLDSVPESVGDLSSNVGNELPQKLEMPRSAGPAHIDPALLDLHGDTELAPGLVDFAVNVRLPEPPDWLAKIIRESTADLAAYPDPAAARAAIATAHVVDAVQVLPAAGGAELFTLLARARAWNRPAIIHPQFTEPEAALRAAGHTPTRVLLSAADGFRLVPGLVPEDADLVIVGNPTNPTSVLHPAEELRQLARPGRVLVVDEAFMDAIPGEPESLLRSGAGSHSCRGSEEIPPERCGISPKSSSAPRISSAPQNSPAPRNSEAEPDRPLTGILVFRSLTKTWGLAGLRAGYAVGDPELIGALAAQQPPWAVSTPALQAMVACLAAPARKLADQSARRLVEQRAYLIAELAGLGLPVVPDSLAPFVLVDTSAWAGHGPADPPIGESSVRSRCKTASASLQATSTVATSRHRSHTNTRARAGIAGTVREQLRALGFAVRRGDTFPGLGPDWIRLAVRDEPTTDALMKALRLCR